MLLIAGIVFQILTIILISMISWQIFAQSEASKYKSYEDQVSSCNEKQMEMPIIRNSNEKSIFHNVMINTTLNCGSVEL